MAIDVHGLEKRLSGGGGNTDPDASLGGAMSTEVILSQETVMSTPIAGVTDIEGRGNSYFGVNPSVGTIGFVFSTTELRFQPPGFGFGPNVDVSADGRYTLRGPSGAPNSVAIIDVVRASLPGSDISQAITFETPDNSLFDDIGAIEAFLGVTNYRCYYVRNRDSTDTLFGVKVYIGSQPAGDAVFSVGLDPAGVNGGATSVGDEETAPGGVVFTSPSTYAGGLLIGDLTPGDNQAIWLKREVAPGGVTPVESDLPNIAHGMYF
jgi:hypothetical protein